MRNPWLLAAIPALLSGCASMQTPYSEVTGERYHLAIADRRAVNIVTVGSTSGWANNQPVQVDPGTYRVVVESRNHAGFRGSQSELRLVVEPCKRYYVNAQFRGQVGASYEPVVDEVEPIAGCRAKT
jgi:hypothetical protein